MRMRLRIHAGGERASTPRAGRRLVPRHGAIAAIVLHPDCRAAGSGTGEDWRSRAALLVVGDKHGRPEPLEPAISLTDHRR
jgi:hypothetical protein